MAGKQRCPDVRCIYVGSSKRMQDHIQKTRHGLETKNKAFKGHNAGFKGAKKKKA